MRRHHAPRAQLDAAAADPCVSARPNKSRLSFLSLSRAPRQLFINATMHPAKLNNGDYRGFLCLSVCRCRRCFRASAKLGKRLNCRCTVQGAAPLRARGFCRNFMVRNYKCSSRRLCFSAANLMPRPERLINFLLHAAHSLWGL
jgi:hypothetical protein